MKPASHWMQLALELAEQAARLDEVPVGAIVVLNDEVIGQGFNQTISSHDPSAHAEIVALRDAASRMSNYRLPGAELYVTIEPCTMCAGALVHARVSHLIYGAAEPKAGAICSSAKVLENPGLNHRVQVTSGICEAEAGQLIADFFKAKRKS
jgi:tRNA(adenine34) deaminase